MGLYVASVDANEEKHASEIGVSSADIRSGHTPADCSDAANMTAAFK